MKKLYSALFNPKAYFAGLFDDDNRNSYLLIGGEDVLKRIVGNNANNKDKRFIVHNVDGIPHCAIRLRKRMKKHILKSNKITTVYSALLQYMDEVDIRDYFYDLWLQHKNYIAMINNKAENANRCHTKKNKDDGYISHLTANRSIRECAKGSLI